MIATWREGWKVTQFHVETGEPISATDEGIEVKYKVGVAARRVRGCGPLAVFVDVRSVVDFVHALAEVNGEDVYKFLHVWSCLYAPSMDRKFWSPMKLDSRRPPGTDFADAVMLRGNGYGIVQKAYGVPRWIRALRRCSEGCAFPDVWKDVT